jgi:GNAT superfamily N-acetyltransferase
MRIRQDGAKQPMHHNQFKQSYAHNPTLKRQVFYLLETCFPGITQAEHDSLPLGCPWEKTSTPFVYFQGEVAITHVGVIELPLVVMGQTVRVGGIHAVGTRPAFRRRGYYRQVMRTVLQYCAPRYDTLVLTTGQPALYEPFGFRVLPEHIFIAAASSRRRSPGFRPLQVDDRRDLQVLTRLLDTRQPVSHVLGVGREKAVFSFNARKLPLYYAADLDLIVAFTLAGTQLSLFDIVGSQIPSLDAILQRLSYHIDHIVTYFSPDRLQADFRAVPHTLTDPPEALGGAGPDYLMVRGPFVAGDRPVMLPHSARC